MRHDYLGATVLQYIGDLGGFAVPIDRHAISAEPLRRIAYLEEREVIAQHHGNSVAGCDTERREAARRPPRTFHDGIAGRLARPADHPPRRGLCHGLLPIGGDVFISPKNPVLPRPSTATLKCARELATVRRAKIISRRSAGFRRNRTESIKGGAWRSPFAMHHLPPPAPS